MALLLVIARESTGWTEPLAAGLVLGAVLCQVDQTLASVAYFVQSRQHRGARAGVVAVRRRHRPADRLPRGLPATRSGADPGPAARLAGHRRRGASSSRHWWPGSRHSTTSTSWFAGVESGLLLAVVGLALTLSALGTPGERLCGSGRGDRARGLAADVPGCTPSPSRPSCTTNGRTEWRSCARWPRWAPATWRRSGRQAAPEPGAGSRSGRAPVASRSCHCTPAPCSAPARPTPTRRPPSPSASRCSGTSTRCSSGSSTRPPTGCARSSGRRTGAPCRCRPPARPAWRPRSSTPSGPGDVVVVAVNGLFGQRMVEVASRCGAEVVRRRARVGTAGRRGPSARGAADAEAHRRRPRRDLHRRPVGPRGARRRQGRRAAAGRLRDLARRRPGPARRLGRRPGLLRLAEVPGRPAGPRAVHDRRPGLGAADREAAELVPRSGAARRLRGGGGRLRRPDLPPHRARPRWSSPCTPGSAGSSRRAWTPSTPGTPRPAGCCTRACRRWARALRRRGAPAAGADHGPGPRRRQLGRRPRSCWSGTTSRSAAGSARRGHRLADRPDGRRTRGRTRRCWSSPH